MIKIYNSGDSLDLFEALFNFQVKGTHFSSLDTVKELRDLQEKDID